MNQVETWLLGEILIFECFSFEANNLKHISNALSLPYPLWQRYLLNFGPSVLEIIKAATA
jgi:hypothetical protein